MNTLKQLQEKGEKEFNEQFGYLLEPIRVTPYYGEDIKKAKLLQDIYSKIGTNILDFLHQQTTLAYNAGKAEMIDMCIETIKQSRTVDENYCFGLKEEKARKQAVIDLKVKLTDKE